MNRFLQDEAAARCLELAWEAFGRGTVPVGAVLRAPDGSPVAEGRSRMYEKSAPPGQLAGTVLAPAEMNALAGLDPEPHYDGYTLFTSLEPCLMCLGATGMSTVERLVFLGPDPYGGAAADFRPTALLASSHFTLLGPDPGPAGALASALHIAFYLERNPGGRTVSTHRERAPEIVAAARRLLASGAGDLARQAVPFTRVVDSLFERVIADVPDEPATRS